MTDDDRRRAPHRRGTVLVAAGLVALAVAAVIVAVATRGAGPSSPGGPEQATPDAGIGQTVAAGDTVVGSGDVLIGADGSAFLCGVGGQLADGGSNVCRWWRIPLLEIEPNDVPGLANAGNERTAEGITIVGTWTGTAIEVRAVRPGREPLNPGFPPTPCPGMRGLRPDERDSPGYEASVGDLQVTVEDQPRRFGGLWLATGADGNLGLVLSVVGETITTQAELAQFPYPLCIVSVSRSMTMLRDAQVAVQAQDTDWSVSTEYAINRVRVIVPVLDGPTWKLLEPFAANIDVRSVVHRP